jgi:hypothetical protein
MVTSAACELSFGAAPCGSHLNLKLHSTRRSGTNRGLLILSAIAPLLRHFRTHVPKGERSFDYLVGPSREGKRKRDAECLCGLRLTISSTLVICWTGSFRGFAPPGRLHKVVVEHGNDGDFRDYFRDAFISVTITNETT